MSTKEYAKLIKDCCTFSIFLMTTFYTLQYNTNIALFDFGILFISKIRVH